MFLLNSLDSQFIFLFLDIKSLCNLNKVNKKFLEVLDNKFYRKYWIQSGGRDFKLTRNYLLDMVKQKFKFIIYERRKHFISKCSWRYNTNVDNNLRTLIERWKYYIKSYNEKLEKLKIKYLSEEKCKNKIEKLNDNYLLNKDENEVDKINI